MKCYEFNTIHKFTRIHVFFLCHYVAKRSPNALKISFGDEKRKKNEKKKLTAPSEIRTHVAQKREKRGASDRSATQTSY